MNPFTADFILENPLFDLIQLKTEVRFHLVRQSLTKVRAKRGLTLLNIKDRHVSQAKAPTMEKIYIMGVV